MSGLSILSILALLSIPLCHAKDKSEWKTAKVVSAETDLFVDGPIASIGRGGPGGSAQTARQRFELDAGDVIYTVEWSVLRSQRLRLTEGDSVQLAVDGKKVALKLVTGKIHKFKLIATYPEAPEKPKRRSAVNPGQAAQKAPSPPPS